MKEFTSALEQSGCEYKINEPLAEYTTFKIGGPCDLFCIPSDIEQLKSVLKACKELGVPYFVIGAGSNLLISDKGIDGCVIYLSKAFSEMNLIKENTIQCASGAKLSKLCEFALLHSLTGLEFAYGIPGSVGGAVYMNAGAYDGEISSVVTSCKYMDADCSIKTLEKYELDLSYRNSVFMKNGGIILSAIFELLSGEKDAITRKMKELSGRRTQKQPLEYHSAGSVFKRPQGNYAGTLIEKCGLKGVTVGGACVNEKHAGFIVNKGCATCSDVLELIELVRQKVLAQTGYLLEPEIRMIGR